MKIIYYLIIVIAFFCSCTKEEINTTNVKFRLSYGIIYHKQLTPYIGYSINGEDYYSSEYSLTKNDSTYCYEYNLPAYSTVRYYFSTGNILIDSNTFENVTLEIFIQDTLYFKDTQSSFNNCFNL